MIDEPATSHPDALADRDVVPSGLDAQASDAPRLRDVPLDLDIATRQALLVLPGRSLDPVVCPFLRADADGDVPPEAASNGHRCVALMPPVAATKRQRQLVCQVAAHPTCPRHGRGEAALRASLAPGLGRRGKGAPIAIGTAAVLLVATAAFAATSGVASPGGQGAGGGAGATATADGGSNSDGSSDALSGASSPSPVGPGASLLPVATVAPRATVRPTLVATRDAPVAWQGLEACPAPDACYLYVVQRGDTLGAIAARFDTTAKKLRKLNPALNDPSTIRVGSTLRVPPPSS